MKCEICEKPIDHYQLHSDESGDYHLHCIDEWHKESAIAAGIPSSVVEGKTKLSDHFSEEYINFKASKKESGE